MEGAGTSATLSTEKNISQNDSDVNRKASTVLGDSFTTDGKGNARWTDERVNDLIKSYGASNPDYSRAYAVLMNPRDFLKLTLDDKVLQTWNEGAKSGKYSFLRSLNQNDLANLKEDAPYLQIYSNDGTMVQGHEGRHRMRALMEAGIKSVPVVIRDTDTKYTKSNLSSITLSSQDFGYDPVNNNAKVTVKDLVPIKESNRAELIEKFGGNAEVRFSTVLDSDGNKLSEGQQEYFANSKITDSKGNLKVMYHGTSNDFNVFDFSQGGKNGSALGFGIYLSPRAEESQMYGDRLIKSYVNMVKPAYDNKKSIKQSALKKFIKATAEHEARLLMNDGGYGNIKDAIKDTWVSNYEYTYDKSMNDVYTLVANSIIRQNDNDMDIIQECINGMGIYNYNSIPVVYDMLTETMGIDGLVTTLDGKDDVILAFRSNQIKNTDNLNPTKSDDIRYSTSIRENLEGSGAIITPGGSVKFSRVSLAETDIDNLKRLLVQAGFKKKEVNKFIEDMYTISASILPDFIADRSHSALKKNSEYYFTLDLSTLCAKRRLYQGTFNAIMKELPNSVMLPKDVIHLRALMAQMGYEVPCGICYEESRKKNEPKFANQWLNGFKTKTTEWAGYANMEHDDPYIPTLYDVLTTTGRARLKAEHPEALESYLTFQKGRGSANPKVSLTHTDYRGEILNMTPTQIANVKKIGGLRVQSFSDFEINHVLDMMQAVVDMTAMRLTSQAYTKVPAFAEIFGKTHIKINLSLIGEAKTVNGERVLVFDNKEGINAEEAFRLREKYPKDVGTIIVGANPESVLLAWADPQIDMVIPFHRSGWSKAEFKALGLGTYQDFQEYQTERYILSQEEADQLNEKEHPKKKYKAGDTITLKKAKGQKFIENADELYATDTDPDMKYWDENLSGTENAKRYLQKCAELHRRPVFYELLHDNGDGSWSLKDDHTTDGYWKSLVDFKMFDNDGNYAPQQEVRADFNMESALDLINKNTENPDVLPQADDVVKQFVKDYKGGRKYKLINDKKATGDDILEEAKKNLKGVKASTVLDRKYFDAIQKNDMKKVKRMVDEEAKKHGYNYKGYHGTNAQFTRFDPEKLGSKNWMADSARMGFFASKSRETAESYTGLNSVDTIFIGEESAGFMQSIKDKYGFDERDAEVERQKEAFFEEYKYNHGYKEAVDDEMEAMRNRITERKKASLDSPELEKFIEETIMPFVEDRKWMFIADWNKEHLNDMWRAWEQTDVYKEHQKLNQKIYKEWEQYEIQRRGYVPHVMELYIKLENPLIHDFKGEGRDTESFASRMARAKEEGHDGCIFLNVADGADLDDIYTVFSNTQFKSAEPITYDENGDIIPLSERFNEKNEDTRYSTVMPAVAELRRENEQLKQKVDYYKSQTKRTKRVSLRTNDIKALVKDLKSSYSSLAESDDLTKRLKALAEEMINDETEFDYAKADAVDIAQDIVFGASELVNDPTRQQYKDLVAWFKGKTIQVVNPSDFPDYNDFRKSVMGKMKLSKSSGHTMGSYWEALQQRFGKQMFPDAVKANDGSESVNDSDLITYVLEMMDFAEDTYENPFSFDLAGAVENCANELIDRLLDESVRQNPPTYADRKERQIERLKIRNAQKVQDAIKRERKKRDDKIKAFKDHQKEIRERRATRRADSDARTKLLNVARRLDKIKTTEANRALIDSLIGELDLVAKGMTANTELKLNELRDWYEEQVEFDPYFKDSNVENKLKRLNKKQISDMDINDVRDLTDALRSIENSIRTADKFINSSYKHSIHQAGLKVIDDVNNAKGVSDNFFGKIDRFFINNTLSPERQIRRVVGYVDNDPLYIATKELSAGQRRMLAYQKSSWDMFKDLMDDKKFINSLNGKKAREIEIKCVKDGKVSSIKVTPDVAISLYLSSMNDDNMRHMNKGGVNIPDLKLYKAGKVKEAFRKSTRVTFSKDYLTAIKGMLTKQEVKFANKAYWYYNMVAPKAINEVSEILKGYSLARVQNYFPIYVDSNFLEKDFESLKFDGTIEGMGSLKERVKSGNPIMINGIVDTLTRSIQENSMYVGLAMPVRNMNKLLGVKDIQQTNVEKNGVAELTYTYNGSVNESINKVWGEATMKYIEKFMSDLQRNKSSDDDWENLLNSLRSNYAGAVLTLNASVAIKQTASYPTAMAVLGYKPLVRAMGNIGKVDLDLIAKYTPLQWYRSQGFSSKELGDIKSTRRDSLLDKVMSVELLNWIQGMDLLTTRKLWKASEYYIREQNKDLKVGTDEYYKAVADIYNRVIEETQPNYTVMQRPGLLRSDKSLVQMLNMFKTQPYQNFNILYDSIGNYVAKRTQYMSSKSEESKKAFKQAGKDMRNAVGSQVIQLAVFAMMTSLWALFRGKDDKYRDEEGDLFIKDWELKPSAIWAYMKQLGKDMVSGAFAMVPLGSEAYSSFSTAFTGDYYYGFSSVTNATISDMFDSMNKAITLVPGLAETAVSGGELSDEQKKAIKNLAESVSRFSGIPTTNILNLYYAGARWASIAGEGEYVGEYEALKMTFAKDVDKKAVLWNAYKNDQKEYERLRKIMIDDGMKEDSLDTYIKDKIKENPSEEQSQVYNGYVDYLEGKSTWENFPEDKQDQVMKILNKISVGIEDGQTEGYTKRDMSPEKVALVKSALYEADMSYGNKNGSYDKDDKKKAVELLKGMLSEKEKKELLNGKW